MQSELANYKNDLKVSAVQRAKTTRDATPRQKPPKTAATYLYHQEATTIEQAFDPEYALHARAQLVANEAYSRELDRAHSFEMPTDYEYNSYSSKGQGGARSQAPASRFKTLPRVPKG